MNENLVILIGNATADAVSKETVNNSIRTSFSLATNRTWLNSKWERQESVNFFPIVCWARVWEIARDRIKKWNKVYVKWHLEQRQWIDDEWHKHNITEVIADTIIDHWRNDNRQD